MTSGGARNRSGPKADPDSGRSDRRGYTLTSLPDSYGGDVPDFPLDDPTDRELELWDEKWRGPHGNAWSFPSETWRHWDVAMWVRTAVRCEALDAPAALLSNLHRFGDRAGLSTAGLAEMGWAIAPEKPSDEDGDESTPAEPTSSRSRFKVVQGGA